MEVIADSFCRWLLELSGAGTDSKGPSYVWVVPFLLCAIGYSNDPKYLPGDEKSMNTWSLRRR